MQTGIRRTNKRRKAFTVMEAVVVMAIFSMLVITFSEIYVRSSRGSAETAERTRIQADARTMLESIARAARVSNIDYNVYGGTLPLMPANELDLVNPDSNVAYRIKTNATDAGCWNDGKSFPCAVVSTDGGASWSALSPKNSKVAYLNFYLSPAVDPFPVNPLNGTYSSDNAPIITMILGLQGFALFAGDSWTYTVQTSVAPRYYKR